MDQIPAIIGIAGRARTGKDTVASLIHTQLGGYRYSFADPIRAMMRAGFDIDMSDPYWQKNKENPVAALGKSPREMMQTLGTEWGRDMVSDDVWLVLAAAKLIKHGPGMIIPDVRFENEAAWIRHRGGTILHVTRKDAEPVAAHSSETPIKMIPGEIEVRNNGTLADLQSQVESIINGWTEAGNDVHQERQ